MMEISDVIRYCPETGNIYWKINRTNGVKAGDIAGSKNHDGYLKLKVFGKTYSQHRIAWFLQYGKFPDNEIDHINRDRSDNRLVNLREVSHVKNCLNQGKLPRNTTGFTGVVLHRSGKYQAQIKVDGICKYIGLFNSVEDASIAYQHKRKDIHGDMK